MTAPRTSESHPIRVDWLQVPWPGKVGLTLAPGKQQPRPASGPAWQRDLAADLNRLAEEYETQVLVSLLEDHEYAALGIPDLLDEAGRRGWRVLRLPIPDGGIPSDASEVAALVATIADEARSGRNVVIHCKGGLGRAGTIGGCVLVAAGNSGEAALQGVRTARGPHAPETSAQEHFIRAFVSMAARRAD